MRQLDEQYNIYVAYINFEYKYGTEESLDRVISDALVRNEPEV